LEEEEDLSEDDFAKAKEADPLMPTMLEFQEDDTGNKKCSFKISTIATERCII